MTSLERAATRQPEVKNLKPARDRHQSGLVQTLVEVGDERLFLREPDKVAVREVTLPTGNAEPCRA